MSFFTKHISALDKQKEYYDKIKVFVIKRFAEILSDSEKEDPEYGFVALVALLRVCANMAVKFGIDNETFLVGCKNIYSYEESFVNKNQEETIEPESDEILDNDTSIN